MLRIKCSPAPQSVGIATEYKPARTQYSLAAVSEQARGAIPMFPSSEVCMATINRILIVDSYPEFRSTLRTFLSREPDLHIVGVAGNMRDAIWSVGSLKPHLVLTDLAMPDARGVEAVTGIKRHYPDVKVLVLGFRCESEFKQMCCGAGAAGYVVKDAIQDELRDGIRAVLGGRTYLGANAADAMVPDFLAGSAAASEGRARLPHGLSLR